jgi:hypothetical protein
MPKTYISSSFELEKRRSKYIFWSSQWEEHNSRVCYTLWYIFAINIWPLFLGEVHRIVTFILRVIHVLSIISAAPRLFAKQFRNIFFQILFINCSWEMITLLQHLKHMWVSKYFFDHFILTLLNLLFLVLSGKIIFHTKSSTWKELFFTVFVIILGISSCLFLFLSEPLEIHGRGRGGRALVTSYRAMGGSRQGEDDRERTIDEGRAFSCPFMFGTRW